MELTGKLITILPIQTGQSSKGEWKKQDAVIETAETYPKKICISFWGDKIDDLAKVSEGTTIKIHINLESREYNGRWFTEVKAWKIEGYESKKSTPIDNNPIGDQSNLNASNEPPF